MHKTFRTIMLSKLFINFCLVAILSISLMFASALSFVSAQNGTSVGGLITLNATWTKGNSPYYLSSPVIVSYGTTLTIDPGVTVDLGGYNLQINGILSARGTDSNNIFFVSSGTGNIVFTSSSQSWNEQGNAGSIIEKAILTSVSISSSASPKISNCTISPSYNTDNGDVISINGGSPIISGNKIYGDISIMNDASPLIFNNYIIGGIYGSGFEAANPVIEGNTIQQGLDLIYCRGVGILAFGTNVFISNNTIFGCKTAINVNGATASIEGNLIIGNYNGITFSALETVSASIKHNTFYNNTIGLNTSGKLGPVSIANNNIVNNLQYTLTVSVANNWWGTADQQIIAKIISNQVNFIPFLTSPDPAAPAVTISIPTPTTSPTPTSVPTVSPISTQTPTPTPSVSPSPKPTPTNMPTPNPTSSPTPTPIPTVSPTSTPMPVTPPKNLTGSEVLPATKEDKDTSTSAPNISNSQTMISSGWMQLALEATAAVAAVVIILVVFELLIRKRKNKSL